MSNKMNEMIRGPAKVFDAAIKRFEPENRTKQDLLSYALLQILERVVDRRERSEILKRRYG